jgi:adenylate kinase
MNLIIFGPPGSGKGTQAEYICEQFNIKHLSTGNIFRYNISKKTDLGLLAKSYMDKGELVPDSVTIKLFESEIVKDEYKNGFLLDGFPRTIAQANQLLDLFRRININIDLILNIQIDDEIIIERISKRLTCPNCGETYHAIFNPPVKNGICDECSNDLITREDDKPDVVKNRLDVYHAQTQPVLKVFDAAQLSILNCNGNKSIEDVKNDIFKGLDDIA